MKQSKKVLIPIMMAAIFEIIAIVLWLSKDNIFTYLILLILGFL